MVTLLRLGTWKDFSCIHEYDFARKTSYPEVLLTGLLHMYWSLSYRIKVRYASYDAQVVACKLVSKAFEMVTVYRLALSPLLESRNKVT